MCDGSFTYTNTISPTTPNPITFIDTLRKFDWSPANAVQTYTITVTGKLPDTRVVSKDFTLSINNICSLATITSSPAADSITYNLA